MKMQKANRLALRFIKFTILNRAVSNWRLPCDFENTLFKEILTKYGTHFLRVLYQKYPQPNLKIAEVPDR
jgi:hypothetical protein